MIDIKIMRTKTGVMTLFLGVFPLTMLFFKLAVHAMGYRLGYWFAFALYWMLLTVATFAIVGRSNISRLYFPKAWNGKHWGAIAFIPAVATFFIAFLPSISGLNTTLWTLLVVAAILNGSIEELFWRGVPLYITTNRKPWLVWSVSLVGFGLWHVTLTLLPGIHYHGGVTALLGGAVAMGILWLFVTIRTNSILYSSAAHILVNLFAFSELLVENWI